MSGASKWNRAIKAKAVYRRKKAGQEGLTLTSWMDILVGARTDLHNTVIFP
jgi:hypothetical protein